MLIRGKIAIVTGAGRGIGRAIATMFADEGARVIATARTESEIREVAAEIDRKHGAKTARAVVADVSREADCQKIIAETRKAFGDADILVNNAAIYGPVQPVEKFSARDWDDVMAVNLRAPMLLSKLALPEMYARKSGVILNVSTAAAKAAFAFSSAYTASKAGLIGLTRTLAAEGAAKGVRVNAICPGPVTETRMSQQLSREFAAYFNADADESLKRMLSSILQGRPQTAAEIAQAALFLVSDRSAAITGQTLNVDGGMIFY